MKGFLNISPLFRENLSVAFRSILSNRLRSVLTILIIAVGITCLVGTETAIEVITSTVSDAYSSMGASSFKISARSSDSSNLSGERLKNRESLTYRQVTEFIDNYDFPAKTTIFITVEANQTAKSAQASTDPNVRLKGIQGDYLEYSGLKIESGRPISLAEQKRGENVCLIGNGVAKKLFKGESAEGKMISVGQGVFRVVGVMEEKGSLLGGSDDDAVLIPIATARKWVTEENSYSIGILPEDPERMQQAIEVAGILFRSCRRLGSADSTDFRVSRNDNAETALADIKTKLSLAALVVGLITLLGAAVGLMNILLVSVKERTREIGTRKALGATPHLIQQQFLLESVTIGQIGGGFGIIFGIIVGNLLSLFMDAPVKIPWLWLFVSVVICLGVSLFAGYLPARRASQLDPIESLRYE